MQITEAFLAGYAGNTAKAYRRDLADWATHLNGDLLAALSCLGFGSLCVGSIMSEPRFGNPERGMDRTCIADRSRSLIVPSRGRRCLRIRNESSA